MGYEDFLFVLMGTPFFLIFLLYVLVVDAQSNRKFRKISEEFGLEDFSKFDIRVKVMSYGKNALIRSGGMYFFDAILYYSDDLIVIKQKKMFSIILSSSIAFFPLILANNPDKSYKGFIVRIPYSIYKFGTFPLKIKYRNKYYDSEVSLNVAGCKNSKAELEKRLLIWLK